SRTKTGVKEVFNFLAQHKDRMGLRAAYATSSERAFTNLILKRIFELSDLNSHMANPDRFFYVNAEGEYAGTCWAAGMKKKPAPDVYLETVRKLKIPPGQCLAFEDSKSGYEAAKSCGINVFVVPSPWSEEYFSQFPYGEASASVCKLNTLNDVIPILKALNVKLENLQSLAE